MANQPIKINPKYTQQEQYIYDLSITSGLYNDNDFKQAESLGLGDIYMNKLAETTLSKSDTFDVNEFNTYRNIEDKLYYLTSEYNMDKNSEQYLNTKQYLDYVKEEQNRQDYLNSLSGFQKFIRGAGGIVADIGVEAYNMLDGLLDAANIIGTYMLYPISNKETRDKMFDTSREFVTNDWMKANQARESLARWKSWNTNLDENIISKGINDIAVNIAKMSTLFIPVAGQLIYFGALAGEVAESTLDATDASGNKINPNYHTAMGYAALTTGIEYVLERASGVFIGGGKRSLLPRHKIAQWGLQSPIKGIVGKLGMDFASEFIEEAAAEIINHYTYKAIIDKNTEKLKFNDVLYAGVIGGIVGMLGGETRTFVNFNRYGGVKIGTTELSANQSQLYREIAGDTMQKIEKSQEGILRNKYSNLTIEEIKTKHSQEYNNAIKQDNATFIKNQTALNALVKIHSMLGDSGFADAMKKVNEFRGSKLNFIRNYVNNLSTITSAKSKTIIDNYSKHSKDGSNIRLAEDVGTIGKRVIDDIKEYSRNKIDVAIVEVGTKEGVNAEWSNSVQYGNTLYIDANSLNNLSIDQIKKDIAREGIINSFYANPENVSPKVLNDISQLIMNRDTLFKSKLINENSFNRLSKEKKADILNQTAEKQKRYLVENILFDKPTIKKSFFRKPKLFIQNYSWLNSVAKNMETKSKLGKTQFWELMTIAETYRMVAVENVGNKTDADKVMSEMKLSDNHKEIFNRTINPDYYSKHYILFGSDMSNEAFKRFEISRDLIKHTVNGKNSPLTLIGMQQASYWNESFRNLVANVVYGEDLSAKYSYMFGTNTNEANVEWQKAFNQFIQTRYDMSINWNTGQFVESVDIQQNVSPVFEAQIGVTAERVQELYKDIKDQSEKDWRVEKERQSKGMEIDDTIKSDITEARSDAFITSKTTELIKTDFADDINSTIEIFNKHNLTVKNAFNGKLVNKYYNSNFDQFKIKLVNDTEFINRRATFDFASKTININLPAFLNGSAASPDFHILFKDVIYHEISHAVSYVSNLDFGASVEFYKSLIDNLTIKQRDNLFNTFLSSETINNNTAEMNAELLADRFYMSTSGELNANLHTYDSRFGTYGSLENYIGIRAYDKNNIILEGFGKELSQINSFIPKKSRILQSNKVLMTNEQVDTSKVNDTKKLINNLLNEKITTLDENTTNKINEFIKNYYKESVFKSLQDLDTAIYAFTTIKTIDIIKTNAELLKYLNTEYGIKLKSEYSLSEILSINDIISNDFKFAEPYMLAYNSFAAPIGEPRNNTFYTHILKNIKKLDFSSVRGLEQRLKSPRGISETKEISLNVLQQQEGETTDITDLQQARVYEQDLYNETPKTDKMPSMSVFLNRYIENQLNLKTDKSKASMKNITRRMRSEEYYKTVKNKIENFYREYYFDPVSSQVKTLLNPTESEYSEIIRGRFYKTLDNFEKRTGLDKIKSDNALKTKISRIESKNKSSIENQLKFLNDEKLNNQYSKIKKDVSKLNNKQLTEYVSVLEAFQNNLINAVNEQGVKTTQEMTKRQNTKLNSIEEVLTASINQIDSSNKLDNRTKSKIESNPQILPEVIVDKGNTAEELLKTTRDIQEIAKTPKDFKEVKVDYNKPLNKMSGAELAEIIKNYEYTRSSNEDRQQLIEKGNPDRQTQTIEEFIQDNNHILIEVTSDNFDDFISNLCGYVNILGNENINSLANTKNAVLFLYNNKIIKNRLTATQQSVLESLASSLTHDAGSTLRNVKVLLKQWNEASPVFEVLNGAKEQFNVDYNVSETIVNTVVKNDLEVAKTRLSDKLKDFRKQLSETQDTILKTEIKAKIKFIESYIRAIDSKIETDIKIMNEKDSKALKELEEKSKFWNNTIVEMELKDLKYGYTQNINYTEYELLAASIAKELAIETLSSDSKMTMEKFAKKAQKFRMFAMLSSPRTWFTNILNNEIMRAVSIGTTALERQINKKVNYKEGQYKLTTSGQKISDETKSYVDTEIVKTGMAKYSAKQGSKYKMGKNINDVIRKTYVELDTFGWNLLDKYYALTRHFLETGDIKYVSDGIVRNMENILEGNVETLRQEMVNRFLKDYKVENVTELVIKLKELNRTDLVNAINGNKTEIYKNISKETFEVIYNTALEQAKISFFRNDNAFTRLWQNFASQNKFSEFLAGMILPFPKVASNILIMSCKYSPAGFASAIISTIKNKKMFESGEMVDPFAQSKNVKQYAQASVGTMFYVLGIILKAVGLIEIDDDEGTVVNFFGIKLRLSDIAPAATPICYGASFSALFNSDRNFMEETLATLYDQTMLSNFNYMLQYNRSLAGMFSSLFENYLTTYIPAVIKSLTKILNAGEQKKYSSNFALRVLQRIAASVPLVDRLVPSKIDPYTGEVIRRSTTTDSALSGVLWEIFNALSPIYVFYRKPTAIESEAKRLNVETTGATGNFSINTEKYKLEGKELTDFSVTRAKYINDNMNKLINSATYKKMDDEERRSEVRKIYDSATEAAKINYWTSKGNIRVFTSKEERAKYNSYLTNKSKTVDVYRGHKGSKYLA